MPRIADLRALRNRSQPSTPVPHPPPKREHAVSSPASAPDTATVPLLSAVESSRGPQSQSQPLTPYGATTPEEKGDSLRGSLQAASDAFALSDSTRCDDDDEGEGKRHGGSSDGDSSGGPPRLPHTSTDAYVEGGRRYSTDGMTREREATPRGPACAPSQPCETDSEAVAEALHSLGTRLPIAYRYVTPLSAAGASLSTLSAATSLSRSGTNHMSNSVDHDPAVIASRRRMELRRRQRQMYSTTTGRKLFLHSSEDCSSGRLLSAVERVRPKSGKG